MDYRFPKEEEIKYYWSPAVLQLQLAELTHTESKIHLSSSCSQWIPVPYGTSSTTSPVSISLNLSKLCLICHIIWNWNSCLHFSSSSWHQMKCCQHVFHCVHTCLSVFVTRCVCFELGPIEIIICWVSSEPAEQHTDRHTLAASYSYVVVGLYLENMFTLWRKLSQVHFFLPPGVLVLLFLP